MGGAYARTWVGGQILLFSALTVVLFAAAGYVPAVGILVSLLAPTPILLLALQHGLGIGLLALSLATLALALLFGNLQSLFFFTEYGLMAVALTAAVRRRWTIETTLLAATTVPLLTSGVAMALLLAAADLEVGAIRQHFEESLGQALRQFLSTETGLSEEALRSYIQEVLDTVMELLPAFFILSTAAAAAFNYGVARFLWPRLRGQQPLPGVKLTQWKAPEACVWVLIASGICYFVPAPGLRVLGLNGLILISVIYLLQGLGVLVFYLKRTSVPTLLRRLIYVFLVIQPLLLLGVAACGLFDLWCDFRRIGEKREDMR